ncbi:putative ribonuclease H-like domain-containing protein [Tanacetum coccineum]|uniref:Ribonuclease H-like domain-containing protein n=1 Tax=Tanacetum coccineum TaxID=301880 RepID=A0ABQ5D2I3_9ASTR
MGTQRSESPKERMCIRVSFLPEATQEEQFADKRKEKLETLLLMAVPKESSQTFSWQLDVCQEIWQPSRHGKLREGRMIGSKLLLTVGMLLVLVFDEDANHKFLRSPSSCVGQSYAMKMKNPKPLLASNNQKKPTAQEVIVLNKPLPLPNLQQTATPWFKDLCHNNPMLMGPSDMKEEISRGIFALRETDARFLPMVTIATQKTQPQVPKPKQTVVPSCAQHVKTPRQPIRTPVTPLPIPSNNRQNWNQRMERELGAGYSFERKPCFVCGSLSHLIKDCDYYEKKMAREAALKSQRVVHANVRQATPAWTNTNRVNKANQFTPRPVNGRPNLSTASKTIKTGRVNVNTGHGNVNSGSVHVNSGTQIKSGSSRFNTGKQNVNSGSVHVNTARVNRPVSNQTSNKTSPKLSQVNLKSPKKCFSKQSSPVNRPFSRNTAHKSNKYAVKGKMGTAVKTSAGCVWRKVIPLSNTNSGPTPDSNVNDHPLKHMEHRGIFDSGCSGHMTGNRAHLEDYQELSKVGSVTFGGSKGSISGKGTIRLGNLVFDDVAFVKELGHFNLFSISQICDKKLNVLFTEKECFVVSSDFKMPDENQVLLKVPRQHNMYTFDMKNVDSSKGYTCLLAKASSDEAKLWHRRLGHLNFKNLNKLVKGNLVRGLPSKSFKNDHTCVACQKGKQHKASCKAKIDRYVTHPLHTLHMDLFGPTSVRSINHASYCLVITDDCSRFCWVFFLAKKDETSDILKTFIRQIENQLNQKVKIIRSDNGTEFKNRVMLEFCGEKGIKQEFSNARTPQQNGVAERMNRTLIEAARTMLADSHLPTTFWAEAVNTACYTFNRVRVTKPQNKTPYELLFGHKPILSYIRPFGCHVTILNTLSPLGKFDGKSDEGFLVGYSVKHKAFRVYNLVTKKVETEEAEELLVVSSTSRPAAGSEHNATKKSLLL